MTRQETISAADQKRLQDARRIMLALRAGNLRQNSGVDVMYHCRVAEVLGTPIDRINAAGCRREMAIRQQLDADGVETRNDHLRRRYPTPLSLAPYCLSPSPRPTAPSGLWTPVFVAVAGAAFGFCIALLFT